MAERTNRPFVEELPRILARHGLSLRAISREVGVSDAHLSRVLRQVNYKTASPDLARRVALTLGLPEDYFPEYREGIAIDAIKADSRLRDEIFDRVARRRRPR